MNMLNITEPHENIEGIIKQNLIKYINEKHEKIIVNLPLGFGKSMQTIELAKQEGFGNKHLIVVNTRKEVDRFRKELPRYFWYYQTDAKKEKNLLNDISERMQELVKLNPGNEEYNDIGEKIEDLLINIVEEDISLHKFNFKEYTGLIITKKMFNELIRREHEKPFLNFFKTITIDEVSEIEFTVKYEFENYNDSTLKGVGKINLEEFKEDTPIKSIVKAYKYKDELNFFEILSNQNEHYFITKDNKYKSYLYMKNTVMFDFFRKFNGKIMILDATTEFSSYIYKEFIEKNSVHDWISEYNLRKGLENLLEIEKKVKDYNSKSILSKSEESHIKNYLKGNSDKKLLLKIIEKNIKYFLINRTFEIYNFKRREYENLNITNYELQDVDDFIEIKMSNLRVYLKDDVEEKNKKENIIKQIGIYDNLIFTNKSTAELIKERGLVPVETIVNYLYSGDDIGSNLYRDHVTMTILYGQTMNTNIIKMLSLFFNTKEGEIKKKIIAQRIVQLIGRTKIREDHNSYVDIRIIQFPELNLSLIQKYFSCNIDNKVMKINSGKQNKKSLLDQIEHELKRTMPKKIVVSNLVEEIMSRNFKNSKNTKKKLSAQTKEILPKYGYKSKVKLKKVWTRDNAGGNVEIF